MNLRLTLAIAALTISQAAWALSAIEYLRMKGASEQNKVMEPIVDSFVARGYKKVPNWAKLDNQVRDLIREKGYTYQNVENVAEEAAIAGGMTR